MSIELAPHKEEMKKSVQLQYKDQFSLSTRCLLAHVLYIQSNGCLLEHMKRIFCISNPTQYLNLTTTLLTIRDGRRLITINHIQNYSFYVHNICVCVCVQLLCVYCIYKYTVHTHILCTQKLLLWIPINHCPALLTNNKQHISSLLRQME